MKIFFTITARRSVDRESALSNVLPPFWNTLHYRPKICSEILYILAFSQQEYGKQSGPPLSIGYHYF
jgi:hypothetical protein